MGFLSNYYNKPGPGVAKDAPKPNRFLLFWQLLGRHFFDFIKLNLLFLIPVVVMGIIAFLVAGATNNLFLALLPFVLVSPFVGGLTFETRNYAREQHVFILHDFLKQTKENWKKFLINGVLFYIVSMLVIVSIRFYMQSQESLGPVLSVIALAVCLGILYLFLSMEFYVPVQIVTFDMPLKTMYKNGLIFAIAGLWRNLLVIVVLAALVIGMGLLLYLGLALPILLLIALLIFVLLLFSFISYLINFTIYPLVDKHMIRPAMKRQLEEKRARGELTPEEEADFVDWDSQKENDNDYDDDDDDDDDDE